ncbi:MAG TPA: DNA repair protein RadA [candidate division Zixibacteria bacterium]|nr:DNA repair protein RadA [candidate division Zixibacteria bacterium]
MPALKTKTAYVCQNCGTMEPRWLGRCPSCGGWNTFAEERVERKLAKPSAVIEEPVALETIVNGDAGRIPTGIPEFDRVLGGGAVEGSAILVGGDPGIGKSTLLLQVAGKLARKGHSVLYISGEESLLQLKSRAQRLGIHQQGIWFLAETRLEVILEQLKKIKAKVLIFDSIQTISSGQLFSPPGSVGQLREVTQALIERVKTSGEILFLVGHVTKDGFLAGPKVLEHMVDAVLYFEGEKNHFYRILRGVKNRFGSTAEIGIFQMTEKGLAEVENPSGFFLGERSAASSGSVVVAALEGNRPLLLEVQALVTPTPWGTPQRVVGGFDPRRLALILAVLEKRLGLSFGTKDVFVNVAGGVKIEESACDLGFALALASSLEDIPFDSQSIAVGEVGLGGEIRGVGQLEARIAEAQKMGFERILVPLTNAKGLTRKFEIEVVGVRKLEEALKKGLR